MVYRLARIGVVLLVGMGFVQGAIANESAQIVLVSERDESMQQGAFAPTWESLRQYQCPDWFRDAKFGIWAHWGPQCQPERNDWYARHMYAEDHWQGQWHREHYGHPSQVGFKDVIGQWQAERWDPNALMALYKRAGAQYFMALANHHDNFDLWDSQYQPWNCMNMGPQKDLMTGWARAARVQGLRFGVSIHAAHAWSWYEPAQGADKTGPLAGVPYDGKLTQADGAGKWWEGYDPQDLYEQDHTPSEGFDNLRSIHARWHWDNGVTLPDQAYCDKFYNRTLDLINRFQPDLVYFDDTVLPLYPISDAGLKIAAHYYNSNMAWHQGQNEAVLLGKILTPEQRQCLVWDVERGASNEIEPYPWQSCTCIGSWHYDRGIYERGGYKDAKTVIQMLIDIVSKNGNMLLSIPVRGDGSLDEKELQILEDIATWMDINQECIFGTRPWRILGEGPALENAAALNAQGFNEGKGKPYTGRDIRFTTKGSTLYATLMAWPQEQAIITSLPLSAGHVTRVTLLGSDTNLSFSQDQEGLKVQLPSQAPHNGPYPLRIEGVLGR